MRRARCWESGVNRLQRMEAFFVVLVARVMLGVGIAALVAVRRLKVLEQEED